MMQGDDLPATKRVLTRLARFTLSLALLSVAAPHARSSPKRSGHAVRVQTGLDVLEAEKFAPLRGKHIGLITNHTGLDAQGRSNIDLLGQAAGLKLVALFSPEHGLVGHADEKVASSREAETG